jgi:dTDP-4-amino-4,6-dideoxygalactose transaminase
MVNEFQKPAGRLVGGGITRVVSQGADRCTCAVRQGHHPHDILMGKADTYSCENTGSSLVLCDLVAAYVFTKLEQREMILAKSKAVSDRYLELKAGLVDAAAWLGYARAS